MGLYRKLFSVRIQAIWSHPPLPIGPGIRLPPDLPDGCVPAGAHTPLPRLSWLQPCPSGSVTEPGSQGPRAGLAGGLHRPHSLQGLCQKEKPLDEEWSQDKEPENRQSLSPIVGAEKEAKNSRGPS